MNKKTLFIRLIFLCAGLFLFGSCSNIIDSANSAALKGDVASTSGQNAGQKFTFNGTLCVTGALPASLNQVHGDSLTDVDSASRSALPSFTIGTNYFYYVIASQKDGNGSVRINSIDNAEAFSLSSGVTFDLELSIGSWEIKCGICDRVSPDFLMSDTYQFTISDTNLSINHTFYPKPSQSGEGLVGLSMTIPATVKDVRTSCSDSGWGNNITVNVALPTVTVMTKNMTTGGKTPSGSYEVAFNFYDENNILLYTTVQTINVFDNMTTNTWVSDGSGLINGSGAFTLTTDLISQFERTTFYVGQTIAATKLKFTASDTEGNGSPYKPFKTLKKAIEIIKLLNAGSSEYRVFVCEDQNLSGLTESLSLVPNDKAINLTIQGFDPQNSERKFILSGYNESQKSQFNGAFIKIAGKSNSDTIVTLRNLSIYGHKNTLSSASNGGGLLCGQAKVLLENVYIRDNECGEKGAGIFATSSSIVTIKDSYIQGNKATKTDGAFGGGIALMASATVYIEGNTHILENESAENGGGIGVSATGSNKLYINDGHIYANTAVNGGGVYNEKELYFSAGGISQNIATTAGGGVYSSGSMFMYGSAVIGDSAKTTAATDLVHSNMAGAKGGGIYSKGNLYLGYSSWASESENTPQELTGGVFYNYSPDVGGIHQIPDASNTKSFRMNTGAVSYNAGRGIYVGKCTFSMTGGTVQGNTAIKGSDLNTEYQLNGAGLYAGTEATIIVSGGTITENHAEENGGGLYTAQNDSIIILEDGTISSNTADGKGNGFAIANGYLKMKGNALVDSNNDVYLTSGKIIEITNALTSTAPVAKVTLAEFSRGKTIVQAAENVTVLTPYKDYFAFTQEGWESKLSADKTSIIIDAPIYVAGQNLHPYCGVAGNDTSGNGTKGAPFATINKATTLMDDNTTDYTIYIDGTILGAQTIPDTLKKSDSVTYKAQSVTIEGVNGLNENGEPKDSLNGTSGNRPLNIKSEVPVTITNLKITGGNIDGNGGGIYIDTGTTVLLSDGVLVTGNTAASGGGIYNLGNLFLYGSAMVGTETDEVATALSYGNKATQKGAGIYSEGNLYLGYKSEGENAELTGGVCGNYNSNSDTYATGGGIYILSRNGGTDASLTISSGNISYNYAKNGAGIYASADVTMSGGNIKGNEGNRTGNGGGVEFGAGGGKTFSMSGDAKIINNKNMAGGAGISFTGYDANFVMNGGEISGNIASTNGGAILLNEVTSGETTTTCNMQIGGSAYIPYGGQAKNNDILICPNTKITIISSLESHGSNDPIGIRPWTYSVGKTILLADSDVTLADEVGKFTTSPDSLGKQWSIDSDGKLSDDTVVSISKDDLSSFNPNSSTVYTIIVDSSFGKTEVESLLSKISGKVGEGTILDLGNSTATSISTSSSYWLTSGVSSITLPATLSSRLGSQFFQNAYTLTEIIVPESNTIYCSQDGVLYTKDMTGLMKYPPAKEGDSFTLPETVYQLYYEAFDSNKNLKKINGLTQIRSFIGNDSDAVFSNCEKLEEIDLSGLTCSSLSSYTIRYSSALKKVIISSNISLIEDACFQTLSSLEEVHFKGMTPPQIENASDYYRNFKSCPNVKFYVPSGAVDNYKNATGTNGFTNPSCNGAASTTEEICAKIFGE